MSEGYGQLCSIYLKLLRTKMEFHTKVSLPVPVPRAVARGGHWGDSKVAAWLSCCLHEILLNLPVAIKNGPRTNASGVAGFLVAQGSLGWELVDYK